jgi:hypothetical protein
MSSLALFQGVFYNSDYVKGIQKESRDVSITAVSTNGAN